MKIKSNENKNKANIANSVVTMVVNEKVGIFFSKQKRTKQLQQENQILSRKVDEVLKKFKQQNQHLKQIRIKNTAVENLLSLLQTENEIIAQQSKKMQQKIAQLSAQKQTFTIKQTQLTQQMIEIQKTLFENTTNNQQQSNLLARYQQQIKNQKTLRLAPDSIYNVVAKLQKDLQLLQRNISIHENKLQAKKKYLRLLQTKEKKEQIKEVKTIKQYHPKQPLNIYQKSNCRSSINLFQQKRKHQQIQKQTQLKLNKKTDLKDYNELIRKKNALMSK